MFLKPHELGHPHLALKRIIRFEDAQVVEGGVSSLPAYSLSIVTMKVLVRAAVGAFSAFGIWATAYGFYSDTQGSGHPILFAVGLVVLIVGGVGTVLWLTLGRRLWTRYRNARELMGKGQRLDALQSDADAFKNAAADWQERARIAEAKLEDWNAESLHEGRLRVVGELSATNSGTTFGGTGLVATPEGEIIIVAVVASGDPPPVDAIFFVEGEVAHDVKAVIQCAGFDNDGNPQFRVLEYKVMTHADLLAVARSSSALPPNTVIVSRDQSDDFSQER